MNKHRLHLVMSDSSKQRMDRLIAVTESGNASDVVRNALKLYEAVIDHAMNNDEFLIRNKETGVITNYRIFEVESHAVKVASKNIGNRPAQNGAVHPAPV